MLGKVEAALPAVIAKTVEAPPTIKETVLAQFKDAEAGIVALAAKYHRVAYDCASTAGMVAAVAARRDLRENGRLFLTRTEKLVKADVNDLKRVMADEVARLVAIVEPVEDAIDFQIKAEEERKAAIKDERDRIESERVAERKAGIDYVRSFETRCRQPGITAERISNGISQLSALTFGIDEWQEFAVPAEDAQRETLGAMGVMYAFAFEREEEAVRMEVQRVELERRSAEMAAFQDELDRQQAELNRLYQAGRDDEVARQQAVMDAAQKDADKLARTEVSRARIAEIQAAATGHERSSATDLAEAIRAVFDLDVSENTYLELAPMAFAAQANTLAVLQRLHSAALECEYMTSVISVQRAAAPPAPEQAIQPELTLTLNELNKWWAPLRIDSAGLIEIGFDPEGVSKSAYLYHDADKARMVAAMVTHLQSLR